MTIYKFEDADVVYLPTVGKFTTENYQATLHYKINGKLVELALAPKSCKPLEVQNLAASDLEQLIEFLQGLLIKLKGE